MAWHGFTAGCLSIKIFLGGPTNLPVDRGDRRISCEEREIFCSHTLGWVEYHSFFAQPAIPGLFQSKCQTAVIDRRRHTFIRDHDLWQLVFRKACNATHVFGNTFDTVQQNLTGFLAGVANR